MASPVEPELGTAQSQLVCYPISSCPFPLKENMEGGANILTQCSVASLGIEGKGKVKGCN